MFGINRTEARYTHSFRSAACSCVYAAPPCRAGGGGGGPPPPPPSLPLQVLVVFRSGAAQDPDSLRLGVQARVQLQAVDLLTAGLETNWDEAAQVRAHQEAERV